MAAVADIKGVVTAATFKHVIAAIPCDGVAEVRTGDTFNIDECRGVKPRRLRCGTT